MREGLHHAAELRSSAMSVKSPPKSATTETPALRKSSQTPFISKMLPYGLNGLMCPHRGEQVPFGTRGNSIDSTTHQQNRT